MMTAPSPHYPVMLPEVLHYLAPQAGEIYVDATLGAGGYTRAILNAEPQCRVIAFDRDPIPHGMAQEWAAQYGDRLTLVKSGFSDIESQLAALNIDRIDALVLDLGVSSMQLDQPERGFSFRFDAPLDMRMDTTTGQSAADLVNTLPQDDLADILYEYGEERASRKIAASIVKARQTQEISHTSELVAIIHSVLPRHPRDKIDPATRTFQALRIAVNAELEELEQVLHAAEKILKPGARLIVVTFHSLEDRIVKNFLNSRAKAQPAPSRHAPLLPYHNSMPSAFSFKLLTSKPSLPSAQEISENSRSRSAKLRAAIRTETPFISAQSPAYPYNIQPKKGERS